VGKLAALGAAEVEAEQVVDLEGGEKGSVKSEEGEEEKPSGSGSAFVFPETSNNLTPAVLKSRLGGKKLKCVCFFLLFPLSTLEADENTQGKHLPYPNGDGGAYGELGAVQERGLLVRLPSLPLSPSFLRAQ
jgi:hypothetical protein